MFLKRDDRIIFLGDSLTQRTGLLSSRNPAARYGHAYLGSYVDILVKRLLVHYPELALQTFNAGVGGIMLPHLLQSLAGYLEDFEPTCAVLFMGQNDAKIYRADVFETNLRQILEILHDADVSVLQLSTTPHPSEEEKNEVLASYDRIVEHLCQEFDNRFVDAQTSFDGVLQYNAGADRPVQLFSDGCHMSELGNQLLADLVFDAMTR
jgi:lysophospholipase L1-like esterase